jgi:hypothetical protein
VDDDEDVRQAYPIEAAEYGIRLQPFACWEDAERQLMNQFDTWDAIILDGKCSYRNNELDDATAFLPAALSRITSICEQKRHQIPWYVLSAGPADGIENLDDLLKHFSCEWNRNRSHKYFAKETERELLYTAINHQAEESALTKLRTDYFPDVFQAIENRLKGTDVEYYMLELLKPMYPELEGGTANDNNHHFPEVRKTVEAILKDMMSRGILPMEYCNGNDISTLNVTYCSLFLAGKLDNFSNRQLDQLPDPDMRYGYGILPHIIAENVKSMIHICGDAVHDGSMVERDTTPDLSAYLNSVNNSSYLIRSFALQLCDLIIWYNNFLLEHGKEETGPFGNLADMMNGE